jgi:transcriptional regulator with XRE-family HTH domain
MSAMPTSTERATALGALVRQRRKELSVTMEAAAAEAAMSRVTWGDTERGTKTPQRGTLERIERVLLWPAGSASVYLEGGPEPQPEVEVTVSPDGTVERYDVMDPKTAKRLFILADRDDIPLSPEDRARLIKIAINAWQQHHPESDSDS